MSLRRGIKNGGHNYGNNDIERNAGRYDEGNIGGYSSCSLMG